MRSPGWLLTQPDGRFLTCRCWCCSAHGAAAAAAAAAGVHVLLQVVGRAIRLGQHLIYGVLQAYLHIAEQGTMNVNQPPTCHTGSACQLLTAPAAPGAGCGWLHDTQQVAAIAGPGDSLSTFAWVCACCGCGITHPPWKHTAYRDQLTQLMGGITLTSGSMAGIICITLHDPPSQGRCGGRRDGGVCRAACEQHEEQARSRLQQ
jgi:hypothetical protein